MNVLNIEPDNFSNLAIEAFKKNGFNYYEGKVIDTKDVNILIVRLQNYICEKFLSVYPNVKFIISATTGEDHIDQNFLLKKNINLVSLKNETKYLNEITATAELNWCLLLSLARNVKSVFNSVNDDNWDRNLFIGDQLSGKNLGIVGFGRLGKMIANYGNSFKMKVSYFDPYVTDKHYKKYKSLNKLLSVSDYISINVSFSSSTENLISYKNLEKLKFGAKIINTSRGKIINEEDLLEKLKLGHVGGYATDVLSNEISFTSNKKILNNKIHELSKSVENILITPHIGGATKQSMQIAEEYIVSKFLKNFNNNEY
jgi:D-3-phosphoglycerate dehydrogenase